MVTYLLFGFLICAALLLLQSARLPKPVRWGGFALLAVVAVWILVQSQQRAMMGGEWYDRTPYKYFILYAIMMVGMVTNVLVDAVGDVRKRRSECRTEEQRKLIRLTVSRYDFLYPFLLSFLTFGWLYIKVADQSLTMIILIIAYETGFFWDSVINSLKGKFA
jgi:hypothetical protein